MTREEWPWWRGAVIYQIYPRSFSDASGDGVGDLDGITAKLPYVADLGVDGIWLSPFYRSPMKDHGYDVADYRAVDPLFGTLDAFDRLLGRAHDLGLKVIVDQVFSHTSDAHAWFRESRRDRTNPRADWYVWADPKPDGTPPNNWLSCFGGVAWQWEPRRRQYYLHSWLASQPDLNLHHPEVQDAILDVARFWLDRGVDGFRLDVVNFYMHDPLLRDNPPRPVQDSYREGGVRVGDPYAMQWHVYDKSRPENLDFLRRLRRGMDAWPGTMTVAEVPDDDNIGRSAEYVAAPDLLHTAYSFALLGEEYSAAHIRDCVQRFRDAPGSGWPSWSFSNHDVPRVRTRWGGPGATDAQAKMLLALVTSLWGTAFVYQGEELGLPQAEVPWERMRDPAGLATYPEDPGRDGCRTPFPWDAQATHGGFSAVEPWLPVSPDHLPRAVSAQAGDPRSVLGFFRGFLAWRRGQPALARGDVAFLDAPEPILAFRRGAGPGRLLAVFNLGPRPVTWALPPGARPALLEGHGLAGSLAGTEIRLPAWGACFAADPEVAR